MVKTRKPAVAGRFYPSNKNDLIKLLKKILDSESKNIDNELSNEKIIGGLVPHAGYIYSAYQAVHFFEILKNNTQEFDTFVLINPNHTGYGSEIALDENNNWESPLGVVNIDEEMAEELNFTYSSDAHKYEHSGEVILPLLQYFIDYEFNILPITMTVQNYYNANLIAKRLFEVSEKLNRKLCVIASSDFSHFVTPEFGKKQDFKVIDKILLFHSENIIKTVKEYKISMCGYGPAACLTEYAKNVTQNPKAKLLKYGHSGEVHYSNDVVDYASILVYE